MRDEATQIGTYAAFTQTQFIHRIGHFKRIGTWGYVADKTVENSCFQTCKLGKQTENKDYCLVSLLSGNVSQLPVAAAFNIKTAGSIVRWFCVWTVIVLV